MGGRVFLLFLVLPIVLLVACAAEEEPGTPVTIAPARPEASAKIGVRFDPAAARSPLAASEAIDFRYTLFDEGGESRSAAMSMRRKGSAWYASLVPCRGMPGDPVLMLYAFVDGDDPENYDARPRDPRCLLFYDRDVPARGAYLVLYRILSGEFPLRGALQVAKDDAAAAEALAKEGELHAGGARFAAVSLLARLAAAREKPIARDSLRALAEEEAEAYLDGWEEWEAPRPETAEYLALLLAGTGRERHDLLARAIADRFPGDEVLSRYLVRSVFDRADLGGSAERLEAYLEAHPDAPAAPEGWMNLIRFYLGGRFDTERPREIVASGHPVRSEGIASLADVLSSKLDRHAEAETLFQMAIEKERSAPYPPDRLLSKTEWEAERRAKLAAYAHGLGRALRRDGRAAEGLVTLERAVAESPESAGPQLLSDLVRWQVGAGKKKEAAGTYERLARRVELPEAMANEWRSLAAEIRPGEDFDARLAAAASVRRAREFRRLDRSALHRSLPDLLFESDAGDSVRLSDFRGSVVLLDFWATWCGPCRRSLPHVDEIYAELSPRGGFTVLPVNTWERVGGAARRREVRDQWKRMGLSMPLYYDVDRESKERESAARLLEVSSIPTSFLIGRDGKLLFRMTGFQGESSARDLRAKIEYALSR